MTPEFLHPLALLLLPLPLLYRLLVPSERTRTGLQVPARLAQQLAASAGGAGHQRLRQIRYLCAAMGWIALVVALAVPVTSRTNLQYASGRDLLVAVDLSASMRARDVLLNNMLVQRYAAVKQLAGEFVHGRAGDRVGLIVFADEAYLLAPLSFDVTAVSGFLDQVQVGLPGRKTALGDAIGLAVKTLQRQPSAARVVILLSDGDGNAGALSPQAAAEFARSHQVRIHTIGFGEDASGDESGMRQLALATGGQHFIAESSAELRAVYRQLDQLEATETAGAGLSVRREWIREMLLLALAMLLLLTLIERVGPGRWR